MKINSQFKNDTFCQNFGNIQTIFVWSMNRTGKHAPNSQHFQRLMQLKKKQQKTKQTNKNKQKKTHHKNWCTPE